MKWYLTYQMAATAVTLNDLEGHSQVAAFQMQSVEHLCSIYTISTDSVLARFLCITRASCNFQSACHSDRRSNICHFIVHLIN